MKFPFILVFALTIVSCASLTPQSDVFLKSVHNLPPSYIIKDVPFYEQAAGHCGPSTLAMVMNWAGKDVQLNELVDQVYTPNMKGSFQMDMITASRRQGFLAVPLSGVNDLLQEVAADHPVIVFENLGLSWWPQWHYAVVFGYDLSKQEVILHSGLEASKHWDIRRFEKSWKLGNYWGLIILPPGRLAKTVGELEHMKAASALEQLGLTPKAEKSYNKILERWPNSLSANMGLANIAFNKKNYAKSVSFLLKATERHPKSASAWHNLAIAYEATHDKKRARSSALRAIQLASPEMKSNYKNTLKEIYE